MLTPRRASTKNTIATTRNKPNNTLPTEAAPCATPVNPNKPAMIATTNAISAHCRRSISCSFHFLFEQPDNLYLSFTNLLRSLKLYNGGSAHSSREFMNLSSFSLQSLMALVHKSKSRRNPLDGSEQLCHFVSLGHTQM